MLRLIILLALTVCLNSVFADTDNSKENEEYSKCPNQQCRPKTCDDLGYPLSCKESNSNNTDCGKPCHICKEGFVRDKNGDCIPSRECPSCGGDPNAWSGSGTFCTTCDNYKEKDVACILIYLFNGCDCRPDYVYDKVNKRCVLPKDCPKKPKCGTNEVYDECPSSCPPRTCETKDRAYKCKAPLKPGHPDCAPGTCRCADNYYKNSQGKCVTKEQCPPICGPNEYVFDCVNSPCIRNNCAQKDLHIVCRRNSTNCKAGCLCIDGYLRAKNGTCVPKEQCPPNCDENEEYSDCPNKVCRAKTCKELGFPLKCFDSDNNSTDCGKPCCICQQGFVKNKDGKCISDKECPSCGGDPNAESGCGVFCTRCDNYKSKIKPCPRICRVNGCQCRKNYIYDSNTKRCVLPEDCSICGPDEVYSDCKNGGCDQRNCSQLGRPIVCIDLVEGACQGGCVCKQGYLRTADGVCVPTDQCPKNEVCNKPNEYFDRCPPSCPARKCGTDDRLVFCKKSPKVGDPDCNPPSCRCKAGYYRNNYGDCVTFEECSIECGSNEIYYPCPKPTCANQTCDNIGKIFNCPLIPANYTCKGECRCQPNFYRNRSGKCVDKDQCKCQGPHEYFACDNACDNECDKLSTQSHANCPIVNVKCNEMCYCEEGYARDSNKICIPISQCPKPVCGANEVISKCANSPCIKNCATKDLNVQCRPDPASCKSGCVCIDGYYRNGNGVCVPSDKCPKNCNENEEYSDCPNKVCRAKTCKELGFPLKCLNSDNNSNDCGEPCCICKEGFVRNKDGKCISERDCPSCGGDPNAESGCGVFCTRCDNYKSNGRACPLFCRLNGCECRKNYIYDSNKKRCVLPEDCPNCKNNEEYSDCPNKVCRAKTCDELGYPLPCNQLNYNNTDCGKKGCICKSGFLRNKNGECISDSDCPSCGGDPNAGPGCGVFCIRCDNYKNDGRACPASCRENGCDCRKNYVYDSNKKRCVLPEDCPLACGPNEFVSKCANNPCIKKNCAQKDLHIVCRRNSTNCKAGCLCIDGYLRADNGTCVPKEQCPCKEVCTKPNEYFDRCPPSCPPRKCGTDDRLVDCKPQPKVGDPDCNPPSCRCKAGYYRNNYGDCVTFEECSNCKKNEEYSDCPNKVCRAKTCDELGYPLPCNQLNYNNTDCGIEGCICKSGFVRNKSGECISDSDCPSCGGDPNAGPGCGVFCIRCDNYKNKGRACPASCQENGCDCRKNYVYDPTRGICVLPENCPPAKNSTTTPPPNTSDLLENFYKGNLEFTTNFLYNVVKDNPSKSVIMSPFSALILLTECALEATDETLEELLKAFNLKNQDEIRIVVPAILDSIAEQKNVTLTLAGRVYGNNKSKFSEAFKKDTREIYRAEAENMDFSRPQAAADRINSWVANQTRNKIKDLVSADMLTPNTELVLVDAIYCLAEWRNKFNPSNTQPGTFYVSKTKNITVDFMNQISYLNYAEIEEFNAKVLDLSYVNENLTCFIFLPNDKDGVLTLVSKLMNPNALESVRKSLKNTRVQVQIPKFTSTTTVDLKEYLQKLAIKSLFDPRGGMVGILEDPRIRLYVSAGIQKANIIVNESGSEASAANAVVGVRSSAVPALPVLFIADHPFVYYLMFKETPIFCGVYADN